MMLSALHRTQNLLGFSDSTSSTVKAGKKANLASVPIGINVTIRFSEVLAISVTKL